LPQAAVKSSARCIGIFLFLWFVGRRKKKENDKEKEIIDAGYIRLVRSSVLEFQIK
jgi:hypothetical protein